MLLEYFPLILMVILGFVIAIGFLYGSEYLGAKRHTEEKETTYESGMIPYKSAKDRFTIKFYMVAVLFILFDIEIVFMYPWAVQFRSLGMYGFTAMALFMVLLFAGYIYVVKKGALKWD